MQLLDFQNSLAQQLSVAPHQLSAEDVELLRHAVQQRRACEGHTQAHKTEIERQAEEYDAEGVSRKFHRTAC